MVVTMETGVLESPKLSKVRGYLLWYGCYHGNGGLGVTQTEQGEGVFTVGWLLPWRQWGLGDTQTEQGEGRGLYCGVVVTMETAGVLGTPKLNKVRGSLLWCGCYHGDGGGLGDAQTEQGEGVFTVVWLLPWRRRGSWRRPN